jgi:hypothetical protein
VHNKAVLADLDPVRTCVKVNAFIQIDARMEANVVPKPESDDFFIRDRTINIQNKPVKNRPNPNTDSRRYPA